MKNFKSMDLSVTKISSMILIILMLGMTATAQVGINADGSSPDGSAMLDVKSDTAGILIPRMTMAQRNAISNPATGLMIYQTDDVAGFYHYDGSDWKTVGSGAFSIDDLSDGKAGGHSYFLGENAGMNDNGTVNSNTAVGFNALKLNTDAVDNAAFGTYTLNNCSGNLNTAIGSHSLSTSTSGMGNTSVGKSASQLNTTGSYNVSLGAFANLYNEEGSHNTIIGANAGSGSGAHNISGSVFLGYSAGFFENGNNKLYIENTLSSSPLIYGEFDNDLVKINGDLEVTGALTGIGIDDLSDGKSDGNSVFLGASAGNDDDGTDNSNTAIGSNAMFANTIGVSSTAIGNSALRYSTESNYNTACGAQSLLVNSTGEYNTVLGFQASNKNTIGNENISIGTYANKYNETGSKNTIIGYQAGSGTALHSKSGNVFLGYNAGFYETGDNKLYIENSSSSNPLIYGEFDNDILAVNGYLGVGTQTPGVKLQVVGGTDAILSGGGYLVTGQTTGQNIVMDENEIMARNNGAISAIHLQRDGGAFNLHYSLTESNEFVVATDGKTGIGENMPTAKLHINTIAGENGLRVQIEGATKLKVASNGGVAVGYNPTTPTFALQLQNSSTDLLGRGIAYSWTTYSDGRLKTDQKELEYGLHEVMQLQPKSYFHHSSETSEDGTFSMVGSQKTYTFGFIAQELNQVIPEAVYVPEDESKNLWAIDYEKLIPVLTKAVQEQQQEIEILKAEIVLLKKMVQGE
jgi:hypothetical protein